MSPRHRWLAVAALLLLAGCAPLRIWTGPKIPSELTPQTVPTVELRSTDHTRAQRLTFLVFGDSGTGGAEQYRIAGAMQRACDERGGCDFALVTGDLIYPTGVRPTSDPRALAAQFEDRFEKPYSGFGRFDFWMVAGNHDWYRRGSTRAQVEYSRQSDRWRMPSLDYRVPLLPEWIAVYGIDTTLVERGHATGQLERAAGALCGFDGWRILFGHHPAYSVGPHVDRDGSLPKLRDGLLSSGLMDCEIDLFFAGHDHLQAHITTPQFEQIVQGAGGRKLYSPRENLELPSGVELLEAASAFGFALVEATPQRLEATFYSVDDGAGRPFYTRRWQR